MSSPFSSGIGVTRPARNPAAQGNVKFEGSLRKRQARRPLSEGGSVFERSPLHVRVTPVRCSDFPEPRLRTTTGTRPRYRLHDQVALAASPAVLLTFFTQNEANSLFALVHTHR